MFRFRQPVCCVIRDNSRIPDPALQRLQCLISRENLCLFDPLSRAVAGVRMHSCFSDFDLLHDSNDMFNHYFLEQLLRWCASGKSGYTALSGRARSASTAQRSLEGVPNMTPVEGPREFAFLGLHLLPIQERNKFLC